MTTNCSNCKRYCGLVTTEDPRVMVMVDIEPDGFTPTEHVHTCGESDRSPF